MIEKKRILPVYLVIDCSSSMFGEPVEAVRQGIKAMHLELRENPRTRETAYISILLFNSIALRITPLTCVDDFILPSLSAAGTTALGAVIELLAHCIDQDITKPSNTSKGDWKPLVFLITDGAPTDDWEEAVAYFREYYDTTLVACGAGADADVHMLRSFADQVITLNTLSYGDIEQFFLWSDMKIKPIAMGQ